MIIQTVNPTTGQNIASYSTFATLEVDNILNKTYFAYQEWRKTNFPERAKKMKNLSKVLLKNKKNYAELISEEMGKLLGSAEAEIEKCALLCDYYAEHAEQFLAPRIVKTKMQKSFVAYNPLGVILSIMPWNFPFWQVFRCAVPALMAGNANLLKHAPITTGSGLAIENSFKEADFLPDLFRTLIVEEKEVERIIQNPIIAGVSLTGSPKAGAIIASQAGRHLKKTVLELGGSDPYIILEDAHLEEAAETIVEGRMLVSGQSCISPKRILAVEPIRKTFEALVLKKLEKYICNSNDPKVNLGPLARKDLRDHLHQQVQDSVSKGAQLIMGGIIPEGPGFYYPPTVLSNVKKGMPAFDEELFGPVVVFIDVKDVEEAIHIANATCYGLGAAIFTQNIERGEKIAVNDIQAGSCFVNAYVKSDPHLPFGGIKGSGYGRELSEDGIREFVNIKTVAIQ